MSRGPIGVEGLTITAGRPSLGDHPLDQPLGGDLALLVGADRLGLGQRRGLVDDGGGVGGAQGGDAGGVDDPLDAGGQRRLPSPPAVPSRLARTISPGSRAQSR